MNGPELLTKYLEENNTTCSQLAEKFGVSSTTVWRWAKGNRVPHGAWALAIEWVTGINAFEWADPKCRKVLNEHSTNHR